MPENQFFQTPLEFVDFILPCHLTQVFVTASAYYMEVKLLHENHFSANNSRPNPLKTGKYCKLPLLLITLRVCLVNNTVLERYYLGFKLLFTQSNCQEAVV